MEKSNTRKARLYSFVKSINETLGRGATWTECHDFLLRDKGIIDENGKVTSAYSTIDDYVWDKHTLNYYKKPRRATKRDYRGYYASYFSDGCCNPACAMNGANKLVKNNKLYFAA